MIKNGKKIEISRKCNMIEEIRQTNFGKEPIKNQEEEHFDCSLKLSKLEKEIDDLKYSTHILNTKLAKNIQIASIKDLQTLEKSMMQQFSKGLDQFGEVIRISLKKIYFSSNLLFFKNFKNFYKLFINFKNFYF